MPLSDEIREAVRRSGRTNYDIARDMNVTPPTLWRFTQGQSGLSLALLDRLAEALDLHITVGRRRRGE
jgi:transcriptional regulator with XRE-family HTH domain